MPPPMPLSGTSRLNSAGSQSRWVSACSKTGRMRSHASAAVAEPSIVSRTVATSSRTNGVSSTYSSASSGGSPWWSCRSHMTGA